MNLQIQVCYPQNPHVENLLQFPDLESEEGKLFKERKKFRGSRWNDRMRLIPPHVRLIERKKLVVYNLNESITNEMLKNHLNQFAKVVDVEIVKKPNPLLPRYKFTAYVKLETNEDTNTLLNLNQELRTIGSSVLDINPLQKKFLIPGSSEFQRQPLSDRGFDLEPADPTKPCIHVLNDYVLLQIFDHFSVKALLMLCVDAVCRRFQKLLHAYFKSKVSPIMKSDLNSWFRENKLPAGFVVVSKVLILCGETLTSFTMNKYVGGLSTNQGRFLRLVGQLCPSLDSITIRDIPGFNENYFKDLVEKCRKLKSFSLSEPTFNDANLAYLLTSLPTLETLCLEKTDITVHGFNKLPETMQVLHLSQCKRILPSSLPNIYSNCPVLKSFHLDSFRLTSDQLTDIGQKCLLLEDLSVEVSGEYIDFSIFKNLKKLKFDGISFSVNFLLKSIPQLEELVLEGLIKEKPWNMIDFSVLSNLRLLVLPLKNSTSFGAATIKSIAFCPKLVTLKYKGDNEHKSALLKIIRACPDLTELNCDNMTLYSDDIDSFVEVGMKRTNRLKFIIYLIDGSGRRLNDRAKYQLRRLKEAKYDIEIFGFDIMRQEIVMQEDEIYHEELYDDEELDIMDGIHPSLIRKRKEGEDSDAHGDLNVHGEIPNMNNYFHVNDIFNDDDYINNHLMNF